MEIVCLSFDPHGLLVATGSMDHTAKLWDVETGQEIFNLAGHKAEIVSLNFNTDMLFFYILHLIPFFFYFHFLYF